MIKNTAKQMLNTITETVTVLKSIITIQHNIKQLCSYHMNVGVKLKPDG